MTSLKSATICCNGASDSVAIFGPNRKTIRERLSEFPLEIRQVKYSENTRMRDCVLLDQSRIRELKTKVESLNTGKGISGKLLAIDVKLGE